MANVTLCDLCKDPTTPRNDSMVPASHRREGVIAVSFPHETELFRTGAHVRFDVTITIDETNCSDWWTPDICDRCANQLMQRYLMAALEGYDEWFRSLNAAASA